MATYTVSISNAESEKDFTDFLNTHKDIKASQTEAIEYDPKMYDKDGNFQRMDLSGPGLPVTDEYMAWRIEQSSKSPKISQEEFINRINERRKEFRNQ